MVKCRLTRRAQAFALAVLLLAPFAFAQPAEGDDAAEMRRQSRASWSRRKTSPEPWLYLGRAWAAEGRKRKALGAFAKALKRDPLSAEAYRRRGRIYEALGKTDEAANEYQAALKADPKSEEALADWKAFSARQGAPAAGDK